MTRIPSSPRLPLVLIGGLLFAAVALTGCGDGGSTHTIDEVREGGARGPVPATADSAKRFGMSGHGDRANQPSQPAKLEWLYATPKGWELLPPKPMRDLGWKVASSDDTECTFTVLPGSGGGLAANVNRWRKQMGLDGVSADAIDALPKESFLGLQATRVDLEGTYGGMRGDLNLASARMLGLVVSLPKAAVFLKMTGPKDVVTAEEANFEAVAKSLRAKPKAPTSMPPGHGGMGATPPGHGARPSALTWQAPEGWTKGPAKAMREVTFSPAGNKDTEAYISILGGDGGGVDMNINRWREQMGLKGLSPTEVSALPRLESLGREGIYVTIESGDFTGQGGERVGGAAMLGFIVVRESDSVFVKMTGPADVVLSERENFEAFCRSLTQ